MKVIPSARKSKSGYKPILKKGRETEVVQQAQRKRYDKVLGEWVWSDKYAVGATYPSREEAIAAADSVRQERYEFYKKEMENSSSERQRQWNEATARMYES